MIITLTKEMYAVVDDADFEMLSQWSWHYNKGYASRKEGNKTIFMHRVINQTPDGMFTDHINGNTLDNRRENLRTCTKFENAGNKKKQIDNTSGYKGVTWSKHAGKWRAQIGINNSMKHIGYFSDKIEAARAYDKVAKEYFGKFAITNF